MQSHLAWRWATALLLGCLVQAPSPAAEGVPTKYPVDYPAAQRFCPPIAGYFDEVQRDMDRVGSRTFRHQPNGGYGLPVQDMVGGQHLLHLGADVGWHRVGEPVYAVANGVVRISEGPPPASKDGDNEKDKDKTKSGAQLAWGNLVVVEHHLPDGGYATTVYGHLDTERLVKVGDIVRAGQQLGTIGGTRVNGGYKPHLHLGVRAGRMAEVGRKLVDVSLHGERVPLVISKVTNEKVEFDSAGELPAEFTLTIGTHPFQITTHDGKSEAPVGMLAHLPSAEFAIVGYALSAEGWLDPTAFLADHGAATSPAMFEPARPRAKRVRTATASPKREAKVAKERE